ncbi:MAG: DUF1553 domain-containing protein, partial [Phycisphaerae bacterium]|nr:DUF1553 domain-containing protein [Phycisphaerae bacterium]
FDNIKHESEGVLPAQRFDLSPATRGSSFGFVFQGVLKVPRNGRYTFFLDSDDGSRLTVDGKAIITHDGIHDMGSGKKATIELKQGRRAIRLDYFQGSGGRGLDIAWSGPGVPRRSLSAGANAKAPAEALTKLIGRHGRELLGDDVHRQYNRLTKELGALKKNPPQAAKALVIKEKGPKFGKAFVYIRGSVHAPGDEVTPGFPEVLGYADPQFPAPKAGARSTGRRSVLANWLGSPENKLTPRVMANRLWQHHFGRGIARSPNDFGFGGVAPTHPDLLDWLAVELVEGGWRLKRMHKLMMTSGTYLMSSAGQAAAAAKDPTNDLFWRFNMRRLGAEEIRDSILAVNGTLNLDLYGPSVYPQIPREVMHGQSRPGSGWRRSTPEQQARRSIYVHVKRSLLLPILESFDLADVDNSCPVRFATTQPTQALGLLNSGFINQQAKFLAARLKEQAGTSLQDQITLALSLVLQRPPKRQEVAWGLDLIRDLTEKDGASADVALNQFCLTALNLNEFVYLD